MRSTLVLALLLVVSLAAPAFADGGRGPGSHGPAAAGAHDAEASDFNNLSATQREHGLAAAESRHAFARFAYNNTTGLASGRYVSFVLDAATGALTHFAVNSTNGSVPVFTAVQPDAFAGNGTAKVAGAALHLDDDHATFSAHNNPTANFDYATGNATLNLTLTLAPNVSVVSWAQGYRLNLPGGLHAHLFTMGNGTLTLGANNATIAASLPADASLMFLRHPGEGHMTTDVHDVLAGLANGHVGAISTIVDADGSPLEDHTFAGVQTHARDASKGHANITLSSDNDTGKAVVLNLDSSVMPPEDVDRIVVTLDGAHLPRLARAIDALNATNASVWFNATPDGVQVIVNVPHFSDHDLSIQSVDATTQATPSATPSPGGTPTATASPGGETTPSPTPAKSPGFELVGALAIVGVAALALARRK